MPSRDNRRPPDTEVEVLRGPASGGDPLESASGHTGPPGWLRSPVAALILAMIIGGGAGYLVGHYRAGTPAALPSAGTASTAGPFTGSVPIAATGNRCAVQQGTRLQLGVEIVNRSGAAVTVHPARVVLPLGGLRVRAQTWGSCAQLSSTPGGTDRSVPPAGTTWLAIAFDVLVPCPAPLPVQISLDYAEGRRTGVVDLLPFPDLGDVRYTDPRCPTGS